MLYFSLFPALVLQAVHYMRKKGCLQSGRLSERAASKLALNVLGMSTLRLIAKSLHRVGFVETRRDVGDREKFCAASMGRRKCALWTSRTCARSTCGSESAQWMVELQSLRFLISAN